MNAAPISESAKSGCGSIGLTAFGAIFFLVGALFMWMIVVNPVLDWNAARHWPTADATIIASQLIEHHDSDGSSYQAEITYRYVVNGKNLESKKFSFFLVSGSRKRANKRLTEYPVGSKTVCFYDPQDPANTILKRTLSWGLLFGLIPLIFMLVGGGIMYAGLNFSRGLKKRKIARDLAARQLAAGGRPGAGIMASHLKTGGGSSALHPGDKLDRQFEGPLKLKPETSRWVVLVIVGFFCLFWNGIVSVFVYSIFTDAMGNWGRFGMGLFLIPFVVIGVLMIAYFFYVLLGLFNPVVEIALSNGCVPLGGEVDIAWEVKGNSNRIRRLVIRVEGQENATYRRGTDTYTDTETFRTIDVSDVAGGEEIRFGMKTIRIPKTSMHSFETDNNEVTWSIEVEGTIPFWPDVAESFPFRVKP